MTYKMRIKNTQQVAHKNKEEPKDTKIWSIQVIFNDSQ